jgi:hypothetical protein
VINTATNTVVATVAVGLYPRSFGPFIAPGSCPGAGPGPPANITITAGNNQSATVNTTFATAFKVQVTDSSNNPISGLTVTLTPPASNQASGTFTGFAGAASLTTDATGTATAPAFTANTIAGGYNVAAVSGTLSNIIGLTNIAGPASVIVLVSGNNQTTPVNTAFGTALSVEVTDQYSNPVSGMAVTFTPPASGAGGAFAGASPTVVTSNSSGIATAPTLTANAIAGAFTVSVTAGALHQSFSLTNSSPSSVPTLSAWGLGLLAFLLLGSSYLTIGRRCVS